MLRVPKTTSFYSTSQKKGMTNLLFSHPLGGIVTYTIFLVVCVVACCRCRKLQVLQ